jgi:hypothetical protein
MDCIGRINRVSAMFAMLGAALQVATQSSNFILVACIIAGLGTGALMGIISHQQTMIFPTDMDSD